MGIIMNGQHKDNKSTLYQLQNQLSHAQSDFVDKLSKGVASGELDLEELKKLFCEIYTDYVERALHPFLKTSFLVVKLSHAPRDAMPVIPLPKRKFTFIEEVFQNLRLTDIFYEEMERVVYWVYRKADLGILLNFWLEENLHNRVCLDATEESKDLPKKYFRSQVDELLSNASVTSREVEHLIKQNLQNQDIVSAVKHHVAELFKCDSRGSRLGILREKKKQIANLGCKYGLDEYGAFWILLLKMCALEEMAFFYPAPHSIGPGMEQGGIVWGLKPGEQLDACDLNSLFMQVEAFSNLLCCLVDKVVVARQDLLFRKFSKRSALAALMSRNMSHNVGSHALAFFGAKCQEIATSVSIVSIPEIGPKVHLESSAAIISYLRERMDFVADMAAFALPAWTLTFPVKAIIQYFQYVMPIREGIVKSEGIKAMALQSQDGDIEIAIPNGVIGLHAFYSIIENITRNSAKYGCNKQKFLQGNLLIHVRVETEGDWERNDDLLRIRVWDEASTCTRELVDDMDSKLRLQIVDEKSGALAPGAWGLKEMRICSAFIGKIAPEYIEQQCKPDLIRALAVNEKGDEIKCNDEGTLAYLCYEFFALRPKEILVIDANSYSNFSENQRKDLQQKGVLIAEKVPEDIGFQFVIIANSSNELKEKIKKQAVLFPSRLFLVNQLSEDSWPLPLEESDYSNLLGKLKSEQVDQALYMLYSKWVSWLKQKREEIKEGELKILIREGPEISEKWRKVDFIQGQANHNLSCELSRNYKLAIFDHHGGMCNSLGLQTGCDLPNYCIFYEQHGGNDPIHPVVDTPPSEEGKRLLLACGLLEAALAKVLIFDERLPKEIENLEDMFSHPNGKIRLPRKDCLKWMGIKVVDGVDYNKKDLSVEDIQAHINGDYTFLLIHYGLIDKLFPKHEQLEEKQKEARKWLEGLRKRVPFVVIYSGRGSKPYHLLSVAKFVEYSNLRRWIVSSKSKFHLVKMLCSLVEKEGI
jgi:hypothetical protein